MLHTTMTLVKFEGPPGARLTFTSVTVESKYCTVHVHYYPSNLLVSFAVAVFWLEGATCAPYLDPGKYCALCTVFSRIKIWRREYGRWERGNAGDKECAPVTPARRAISVTVQSFAMYSLIARSLTCKRVGLR